MNSTPRPEIVEDEEKPLPPQEQASEDEDVETAPEEASADDGEESAARIAELEAEVSDLKDRLLRTAAETENVRKRGLKDVEDARKFSTQQFSQDVLAVADNLARALESVTPEARKDATRKVIVEGVKMTMKEFGGVLERHGIRPIEAEGARFDPNFHQAMFEAESADVEPGHVMQVLRIGYTIHGRLLRPAMVAVAKAPPEVTEDS